VMRYGTIASSDSQSAIQNLIMFELQALVHATNRLALQFDNITCN
jgi:hypothetical protein